MHIEGPSEGHHWEPDDDLSPEVLADMAARLAETVIEYPMMPLEHVLVELWGDPDEPPPGTTS